MPDNNQFDNIELIKKLLPLIEKHSDCVLDESTRIIRQHFALSASSIYLLNSGQSEELTLRGKAGFHLKTHDDFHLSYHSSGPGEALRKRKTLIFNNILDKKEIFGDLNYGELIDNSVKSMIAVPFTTDDIQTDLDIDKARFNAVLCMFPPKSATDAKLKELENSANLITPFLSEIYFHSVVYDRILLRRDVVKTAFSAKDLNSFLHKVLHVLRNNWKIEAASAYMLDERTQTLRLGNTTGLDSKKPKEQVFINLKDIERPTHGAILDCFDQKCFQIRSDMAGDRFREACSLPIRSVLYIPIFQQGEDTPKDDRARRVIGVLKCVNRIVETQGLKDSCGFSISDVDHMESVAEFIGVVAILFWRVMHVSEDFERTVHGIQNNVVALRASLSNLYRHGDLHRLDKNFQYVIPDSLSHLDALKWQIEKFSNRGIQPEINIGKTWLQREIIFKALQIARPLAHYFNIQIDIISGIDHKKLRAAPRVNADPDLMVTVFRNLIENAIKYANADGECLISIWWEDGDKIINVFIGDNGIGIDTEDENLIFNEGYRSEAAMRRVSSGASAGLGLYQCKTIMQEMGGDIVLHQATAPTTFKLTIPKG